MPGVLFVDVSATRLNRPAADLVYSLGGVLGHNPVDENSDPVNNAAIITTALENREKIVVLPPGIIEITEPIVWPARSGITLVGCGENADLGDDSFLTTEQGGTCTRIVAKFTDNTSPMLTYKGKMGRISGISFEGYRITQDGWNYIVSMTTGNPIRCTCSDPHQLVDGDRIQIHGQVSGTTAINGNHYVNAITSTTFDLYSDSGLTSGVDGASGSTSMPDAVVWRDYNRAQVGIHVVTHEVSGFTTGKLDIRNCTFTDLPVGILWGTNLEDCDATAGGRTLFTESANDATSVIFDDVSADESVIEHCTWRNPVTNGDPGHRVCSFHRTIQSLGFTFRHCTMNGWFDEGSYWQRGGGADMEWYVNGNCTWVLRIGKGHYQVPYNLCVSVDGGTTEAGGWNGRHTGVVYMDSAHEGSTGCNINVSGCHRAGSVHYDSDVTCDLPFFKLRGPCKCTIQNFTGMPKYGVQAIGYSTSAGLGDTDNFPVICTLRNVTACHATPGDTWNVFHTLVGSGSNQSVAPVIYRWYDCQRENAWDAAVDTHLWLKPVTDGQDITDDGEVEFQT